MMKRIRWTHRLAWLLAVALAAGLLPTAALAADAPTGQPTGEYTLAQTKFSGQSTEPMSDADVHSYFRIPAMVTLDNGWIVAASDARWTNTNDSPNNLDTIVSVSKDGGTTWNWEIINYFADYAPVQDATYWTNNSQSKKASASFIDPAMLVDGEGTLWMGVDVLPSYGGNAAGNKLLAKTNTLNKGFDAQGRLLLALGTANADAPTDAASYTYYADINNAAAGEEKTVDMTGLSGEAAATVKLWPICDSVGTGTDYYIDAFFNTYFDYKDAGGVKPVLAVQTEGNNAVIHNNIFYRQSAWKLPCTFFLMLRSAEVVGDKLVWSDPRLLNVKNDGEAFTAFCPGRGFTTTVNGTERLIFQVYDNSTTANLDGNGAAVERASVIYSDDGGATWIRGARTNVLGTSGSASESQIVRLPNGNLRMYSRNTNASNQIGYTDSTDGGATWGATELDPALNYCGGCMVSFINVEGVLVGPENQVYENIIMASYPKNSYRSDGVIRIGSINAETNAVTWINTPPNIRYSGRYNYSCLTQIPGTGNQGLDSFAVLYEKDTALSAARSIMAMNFDKFTVADIMGDGWVITRESPSQGVTLTLEGSRMFDIDIGKSVTLTPVVTPANVPLVWTTADETVATVENGVITGAGKGQTTVTASATVGPLTRSITVHVMVQDPNGELTLPEQYVDGITTIVTPGRSGYRLVEDANLADGNYVIHSPAGGRAMHNSDPKTNHITLTVVANTDNKDVTTGTFGPDKITFQFTKLNGNTYTIQTYDKTKYLTATASGSQLAFDTEPVEFSVSYQGDGTYYIMNGENYLAFSGGWQVRTAPDLLKLYRPFTDPDTTTYAVSADGLRQLLRAMNIEETEYADILSLAREYSSEEEAQAALAQVDTASKGVYALLRQGNMERYLVTYTVGNEMLGVQIYFPGEIIRPMTNPVRAGKVFTGWDGMPEGNVMPEHDVELVARFRALPSGGGTTGQQPGTSTTSNVKSNEAGDMVTRTVMADKSVNLTVENKTGEILAKIVCLAAPPVGVKEFADVPANHWAKDAIATMVAMEVIRGKSENAFDLNSGVKRADMAVMLHRLSGKPMPISESAFGGSDAYYTDGVSWVIRTGLVTGGDAAGFLLAPGEIMTREQLAMLLTRYAALLGIDTQASSSAISTFADASAVHSWAVNGLAWCVTKGIIEGKGENTLDPAGQVTRAQAVVFLSRFLDLIK